MSASEEPLKGLHGTARMYWGPSSPWQLNSSSTSPIALGARMRNSASTGALSFAEGRDYEATRTPAASSSQCQRRGEAPDPWLQSWIEFQVDARINQALRGILHGELQTGIHDRGSRGNGSSNNTMFSGKALQKGVNDPYVAGPGSPGSKDLDDPLLVVEKTLTTITSAMEDLQRTVSKETVSHKVMEGRLAQIRADVNSAHKELDLRVRRTQTSGEEREASFQKKLLDWQGDVERYVERQAGSQSEQVSKLKQTCLEVLRSELTTYCASQQRQCSEKLQQGLQGSRQEMHQEIESLRADLEQTRTSHSADIHRRFEQLQLEVQQQLDNFRAKLQQEVVSHLQRSAEDLRLETRTAIRSEASAVANLDHQLLLMDQRLGQRIDELMATSPLERQHTATRGIGTTVAAPSHHLRERHANDVRQRQNVPDDDLVTPRPYRPQELAGKVDLRRESPETREVIMSPIRHTNGAPTPATLGGECSTSIGRSPGSCSPVRQAGRTTEPRQPRGRLGSYFAASAPLLKTAAELQQEASALELRRARVDVSPGLSVTPRSLDTQEAVDVEERRSTTSTQPTSARSQPRRRGLAPRVSRSSPFSHGPRS